MPEGTVYVDVPKAALICRKLKFDHVPAVIGFEKGPNGRSHPCIQGVVTFKRHDHAIRTESVKIEAQAKAKEEEKIQAKAK